MAAKETGTIFMSPRPTEKGLTYFSGDTVVQFTATDQLAVKIGDGAVELFEPKANNFGQYWIAKIGNKRYFVSQRVNSKGKYVMCKIAPEREQSDAPARSEGPKTYGART